MCVKQLVVNVCAMVFGSVLWGSVFAQQGVLSRHPMTADHTQQWKLPGRLDEISGLALSPQGRLFAVSDERAAIYELDYVDGRIIKAFAFGDPVEKGDFEGIAYLDDHLWLTTSEGEIYAGKEGDNGEQVPFRRWSTKLGKQCEIEGLGQDQQDGTLLLVCKQLKKNSDLSELSVFTWSARDQALVNHAIVTLPVAGILRAIGAEHFNPSGIAVAGPDGHFLIVASRQRAVAEVSASGDLINAKEFPLAGKHRQSEGIEVTDDVRLLISDEGGNHKARLALYWPQEGT